MTFVADTSFGAARAGAWLVAWYVTVFLITAFLIIDLLPRPGVHATTNPWYFRQAETASVRVLLPDNWRSHPARTAAMGVYEGSFEHGPVSRSEQGTETTTEAPWSVFIPRHSGRVKVLVNGVELSTSDFFAAQIPDQSAPFIALVPPQLLKADRNRLLVHLEPGGLLLGFLDQVYVGPDKDLRRSYAAYHNRFILVPILLAFWQLLLAGLLVVIWLSRRQMNSALYTALFLLAASFHHLPLYLPHLEAAGLIATAMYVANFWQAIFGVLLVCALLDREPVLSPALLGSLGLAATALFLFGADTAYDQFAYGAIIPLSLVLGAIAVILVADGAIRLNRWDCHMLFVAGIAGLAMAVHDTLIINNVIESTNGLKSTIVMIIFLPAISIIFVVRLIGSFGRAERLATSLDQRLRERDHLIRSERTRIMRDIHDGLGGQLMSIVALSRSDMTDRTEIEGSARRALHELRLLIRALDFDGDLSQLLATFREHAENQLGIAGITLDWRIIGRPGDWPVSAEEAMQILRILQEATTNAAHHSGADRVDIQFSLQFEAGSQIAADMLRTKAWLMAVVADNGRGLESGSGPGGERCNGNGLANMRARAERLGGVLNITSGVDGTIVQLRIPLTFVSQDGGKGSAKY